MIWDLIVKISLRERVITFINAPHKFSVRRIEVYSDQITEYHSYDQLPTRSNYHTFDHPRIKLSTVKSESFIILLFSNIFDLWLKS